MDCMRWSIDFKILPSIPLKCGFCEPSSIQKFGPPRLKKGFKLDVAARISSGNRGKKYPFRKNKLTVTTTEEDNEVNEEADISNLRLAMINRALDLINNFDQSSREESEEGKSEKELEIIRDKKASLQQNISIAKDLLSVEFDMTSQFINKQRTGLVEIEYNENSLLEELNVRNWTHLNKCYPTKEISKIMANFGGFPEAVFYRVAMKVVLRLFFKYFSKDNGKLMYRHSRFERSFALIGTRGVGKSTLLVFLAFYLAMIGEQRVLYLRKENDNTKHYLLYMTPTSVIGGTFKSLSAALTEVDNISRGATFWFFVDGYTGEDLEAEDESREFSVLGTYSKSDVKTNHPTRACHLAIWEYKEFVQYSEQAMTNLEHNEESFEKEFTRRFRDASGSIGNFLAGKRRRSSS